MPRERAHTHRCARESALKRLLERAGDRPCITRHANNQRDTVADTSRTDDLRERHVNRRGRRLAQRLIGGVMNDADNYRVAADDANRQTLAENRPRAEISTRERAIHNRNERTTGRVTGQKLPAFDQTSPERREVLRANRIEVR
jgi:hypothetical protein